MQQEKVPTILIIDDNQDDYEAMTRSFNKFNFFTKVNWCRSGKEALDFLNKTGTYGSSMQPLPDLILLDLNMPGLDGRYVLEKLKDNKQTCQIPVVILTTSSDLKDIDSCYQLGASTFIQKPVTHDTLSSTLRTLHNYWFGIALLPSKKDITTYHG